jgi:hypothetical protein
MGNEVDEIPIGENDAKLQKQNDEFGRIMNESIMLFAKKNRQHNGSFFDNDLMMCWLDARRKFDRVGNGMKNINSPNQQEALKYIQEELVDLVIYSIMFKIRIESELERLKGV